MQSGVFVVDKPVGISTNQLIQKIKKKFGIQKIGHAGTLDPLASGVVLVLVNQATKLSDYLLSNDKGYEVTIRLFQATSTYDQEGEITQKDEPFLIKRQELKKVIKKYQKFSYYQEPPIFSAIKVKGKKLYQYALNQETVKIEPRLVTIKKMDLVKFKTPDLTLRVQCSKGTYIRSLAVDLAKDLKTVGHVKTLNRTQSGNFTLKKAKQWDKLTEADLIKMNDTLKMAKLSIMKYPDLDRVAKGQRILIKNFKGDEVFIANKNEEILAVYQRQEDNWFACKRGGMNLK